MSKEDNTREINQILMQFGPLHGNVEKQEIHTQPTEQQSPSEVKDYVSPIHLSKKGKKIDIIRIANAIYELGMVEDANGARMTKIEYMMAFGKMFNVDLSNYDKDLSNSMASSVADEKQVRIFEELKNKHMEIYNRK